MVIDQYKEEMNVNITRTPFGAVDGKEVFLFTLVNNNNMTVKIINLGGIITSILVPDRSGKLDDVVLGFNHLSDYLREHPYVGAIVGRYGNRIAKGRFVLNGQEYRLALNDGNNHLHGGYVGFHRVVWEANAFEKEDGVGVELRYLSKDGEEGYPGNLATTVRYLLTDRNEIVIDYYATTDQPTVVNLTQHSYFNLKGEGCGDILNHEILINAHQFTAVDEGLIPTGELRPVKDTPLDFTTFKPIGARIHLLPGGYDHNYVLNREEAQPSLAAEVREPQSGRVMSVYTTEPGMQFYSGNSLDGTFIGKRGVKYEKHSGFCLETQHFPDSPNHPEFPSTVLNPGEVYRQTTIYRFSTAQ
ncbi:MAG: galactose mutarotase [Firmicutes bacterium]|nr:galactose mutarotase [Bacillota bacterium]